MKVGDGMYRDCLPADRGGCGIRMGCHIETEEVGEDGKNIWKTLNCADCTGEICPDTIEISHGLCDPCYEKARLRIGRELKH